MLVTHALIVDSCDLWRTVFVLMLMTIMSSGKQCEAGSHCLDPSCSMCVRGVRGPNRVGKRFGVISYPVRVEAELVTPLKRFFDNDRPKKATAASNKHFRQMLGRIGWRLILSFFSQHFEQCTFGYFWAWSTQAKCALVEWGWILKLTMLDSRQYLLPLMMWFN